MPDKKGLSFACDNPFFALTKKNKLVKMIYNKKAMSGRK